MCHISETASSSNKVQPYITCLYSNGLYVNFSNVKFVGICVLAKQQIKSSLGILACNFSAYFDPNLQVPKIFKLGKT